MSAQSTIVPFMQGEGPTCLADMPPRVQQDMRNRNQAFLKALFTAHRQAAIDLVTYSKRANHQRELRKQVECLERQVDRATATIRNIMDEYKPMVEARPPVTDWGRILNEVCKKYGLSRVEIFARRRTPKIVWPRQELMYRLYKETRMSLPDIGRRCGGFDHTTVLHACRSHAKRYGLPPVVNDRAGTH